MGIIPRLCRFRRIDDTSSEHLKYSVEVGPPDDEDHDHRVL
jgi:hypothetical protein